MKSIDSDKKHKYKLYQQIKNGCIVFEVVFIILGIFALNDLDAQHYSRLWCYIPFSIITLIILNVYNFSHLEQRNLYVNIEGFSFNK